MICFISFFLSYLDWILCLWYLFYKKYNNVHDTVISSRVCSFPQHLIWPQFLVTAEIMTQFYTALDLMYVLYFGYKMVIMLLMFSFAFFCLDTITCQELFWWICCILPLFHCKTYFLLHYSCIIVASSCFSSPSLLLLVALLKNWYHTFLRTSHRITFIHQKSACFSLNIICRLFPPFLYVMFFCKTFSFLQEVTLCCGYIFLYLTQSILSIFLYNLVYISWSIMQVC